MEIDEDLHPWLRGIGEAALARIAVDLTRAICRPSFGSLSKRELEQTLFALLYEHRETDWRNLGEIADDLAISRTKARSLVLEYRARRAGAMGKGERAKLLRKEVLSWPGRNVDQQGGQLRIVVDDPFIRDLLKNYAYGNGILLDRSFSGEILVFDWDAYGQLVSGLYASGMSREDGTILMAGLRERIEEAAATERLQDRILKDRIAQLDKDIEVIVRSKAGVRADKLAALGKKWGPGIARGLWAAAGVGG